MKGHNSLKTADRYVGLLGKVDEALARAQRTLISPGVCQSVAAEELAKIGLSKLDLTLLAAAKTPEDRLNCLFDALHSAHGAATPLSTSAVAPREPSTTGSVDGQAVRIEVNLNPTAASHLYAVSLQHGCTVAAAAERFLNDTSSLHDLVNGDYRL